MCVCVCVCVCVSVRGSVSLSMLVCLRVVCLFVSACLFVVWSSKCKIFEALGLLFVVKHTTNM